MSTPIKQLNPSAKISKTDLLKQIFCDHKHYPYGFSRSGDFSIAESKALAAYGCYFNALANHQLPAISPEEIEFLAVNNGECEPSNTAHRAWMRYQKRINRPKAVSIHGCKKVERFQSSEEDEDDLIDLDVD